MRGASVLRVEVLHHPLSIDCFRDGGGYALPDLPLTQTNLFMKVGWVDRLYLKVPSERGLEDYRKFVKLAQTGPEDVRQLEERERFELLPETLKTLPDLAPLTSIGSELAHYVAIHKLQYQRLQQQNAVRIPRARFGTLQRKGWAFFRSFEPALFQERICGTTLWSIFDFGALMVMPRWRPFASTISAQLSNLLDSGLRDHIDWNIKNFVFDEQAGQLFYVDLKPTTFVARQSNQQNLEGIRRYYLV
jgi:hypothetical protein